MLSAKARTSSRIGSASGGSSIGLGPGDAPTGEVDEVGGGLVGVEEVEQGGGPAHVEVGVVLPGDGDAAVHLGVEVGAQVGGRARPAWRRPRRRSVSWSPPVAAARAASHTARGGQLGGHDHVGAVVLDRLVHGDDPAELHALLGVGGGQLGALAGQADGLGRQDHAGEVDEGLARRRGARWPARRRA